MYSHIDYMRSWVRLNTVVGVETWGDVQILESFAILPLPSITFPEWMALVDGGEKKDTELTYADSDQFKSSAKNLIDSGIVSIGA